MEGARSDVPQQKTRTCAVGAGGCTALDAQKRFHKTL